jgi:hypothetical protein
MPRYYFHVINGDFFPDTEGLECTSADEVKTQAVRIAGAMLQEQGLSLWKTGRYDMFVCDEQNQTHLRLSFHAEDLKGDLS